MKQKLSEWASFYWVVPVVIISLILVIWIDRKKWKKQALWTMLALWFLAALYLMFLYRLPGGDSKIVIIPFHMYREALSYEESMATNQSLRQIIFNILLFVPLGAILYSLTHRSILSIMAGIVISMVAEVLQFMTSLGWADIDDVISNSIGILFGVLISSFATRFLIGKHRRDEHMDE